MNIERIKRKPRNHRKSALISIRITPAVSNWLRDNNYSPTGIFEEAIKDLGYEDGNE